ncbi:MAG: SDR family NAD(P)-dependent oxidoreductase [Solirubrobacteraceae bacterium]
MRVGEALNAFAKAAHAPQLALRIDKRLTDALPKGTLSMLMKLPQARDLLADLGIPEQVVSQMALRPQFDTRDTERALAGSGIEVPQLPAYADRLWDYWERTLDPDLYKDRSFAHLINGRTVVITGASSGIGRATALKVAAAGGVPLLVARGTDKLESLREEIEAAGGAAHVYPADLSDVDAIEAADLICEAIRARPKSINTKLGTAGEVLYAVAPKAVDQILHMAYKVFPDSAASRGEKDPQSAEKASVEQIAMANIMKGVHW